MRPPRHQLTTLLSTALAVMFSTALALAQTAPLPESPAAPSIAVWPDALVLPWRLVGIDADESARSRQALNEATTRLTATVLSAARPLDRLAPEPLSINLKRRAATITAGMPQGGTRPAPLALETTWCSLMDQHLVFVTIADAQQNRLLTSQHAALARSEWTRRLKDKSFSPWLSQTITRLAQAALASLSNATFAPATDALHVGLALGRHVSRRDEGSSHCLNLLVEEKLAPDFIVSRSLGQDVLTTVRHALALPAALRRPTRGLLMRWTRTERSPGARLLPVTFTLETSFSERVFGRKIPESHESQWTFRLTGESVSIEVAPGLQEFLAKEKQSLALADWPQVAKINRAWVYLDRGRAWGLKMKDRLLARTTNGIVKGHVVRFFGPEEGVVSPRGYPVREGAILFIRKDQRKPQIGMEFRFDETSFPTDWPPRPTP